MLVISLMYDAILAAAVMLLCDYGVDSALTVLRNTSCLQLLSTVIVLETPYLHSNITAPATGVSHVSVAKQSTEEAGCIIGQNSKTRLTCRGIGIDI